MVVFSNCVCCCPEGYDINWPDDGGNYTYSFPVSEMCVCLSCLDVNSNDGGNTDYCYTDVFKIYAITGNAESLLLDENGNAWFSGPGVFCICKPQGATAIRIELGNESPVGCEVTLRLECCNCLCDCGEFP